MPGRRITDQQVRRFMDERRKGVTQIVAAARAGMSERSARRYQHDPTAPSQRQASSGRRTRIDPLADVWDSEIAPMLTAHPHLRGTTILEELRRCLQDASATASCVRCNVALLTGAPWKAPSAS